MSLIKTYYHSIHEKIMSDFHETALRQYEEEQDRLYREEKEREENPTFYWHIVTDKWEEYVSSEEEAAQCIEQATMEGLKYSCTKHVEGETYGYKWDLAGEKTE
mgnify:CR=1 FL=1